MAIMFYLMFSLARLLDGGIYIIKVPYPKEKLNEVGNIIKLFFFE